MRPGIHILGSVRASTHMSVRMSVSNAGKSPKTIIMVNHLNARPGMLDCPFVRPFAGMPFCITISIEQI